jgi:hypothetical protein
MLPSEVTRSSIMRASFARSKAVRMSRAAASSAAVTRSAGQTAQEALRIAKVARSGDQPEGADQIIPQRDGVSRGRGGVLFPFQRAGAGGKLANQAHQPRDRSDGLFEKARRPGIKRGIATFGVAGKPQHGQAFGCKFGDQVLAPAIGQAKVDDRQIRAVEGQVKPGDFKAFRPAQLGPGALQDQPKRVAGETAVIDDQQGKTVQRQAVSALRGQRRGRVGGEGHRQTSSLWGASFAGVRKVRVNGCDPKAACKGRPPAA